MEQITQKVKDGKIHVTFDEKGIYEVQLCLNSEPYCYTTYYSDLKKALKKAKKEVKKLKEPIEYDLKNTDQQYVSAMEKAFSQKDYKDLIEGDWKEEKVKKSPKLETFTVKYDSLYQLECIVKNAQKYGYGIDAEAENISLFVASEKYNTVCFDTDDKSYIFINRDYYNFTWNQLDLVIEQLKEQTLCEQLKSKVEFEFDKSLEFNENHEKQLQEIKAKCTPPETEFNSSLRSGLNIDYKMEDQGLYSLLQRLKFTKEKGKELRENMEKLISQYEIYTNTKVEGKISITLVK